MTDELELVRRARPEVRPASEGARVAARNALDDAIATGRVRQRRRFRIPLRLGALVPALGVLVVIAVVVVFLGIRGTKSSGPASPGGLQLVFRATPRVLAINSAAMSRTLALVRLRLSSVVPGAHVSTSGDEVLVNISGGTRMSVNELVALIGSPGQLLFYDWEANVLTPNGHTAASQLQARDLTAMKISQGSSGPPGGPGAGGMPLYQAVTLAAKQPKRVSSDNSRQGPEYFMFGAPGSAACTAAARAQGTTPVDGAHCLLSGPDDNPTDLYSGMPSGVSASQGRVLTVQQGTVVLQEQALVKLSATAWNNPNARFYVLKDHVSLFGNDTTNPQQSTNQSGSPDVRFGFTSHGAKQFQNVTAMIARRGQLVSAAGTQLNQHFAIALDTQLLTVPSIDFKTYPDGVPAEDGADISTGLTKNTARRLAAELRLGPLPVHLTLVSSSHAIAPTSTSAPPNGLKGTYHTTIHTTALDGALNGGWRLELQNSAYTLTHTGRIAKNVVISGSYSVAARRITLKQRQGACSAKPGSNGCRSTGCPEPGTGTYGFAEHGDELTFTSVADPCESRRVVLAGSFHKVR